MTSWTCQTHYTGQISIFSTSGMDCLRIGVWKVMCPGLPYTGGLVEFYGIYPVEDRAKCQVPVKWHTYELSTHYHSIWYMICPTPIQSLFHGWTIPVPHLSTTLWAVHVLPLSTIQHVHFIYTGNFNVQNVLKSKQGYAIWPMTMHSVKNKL